MGDVNWHDASDFAPEDDHEYLVVVEVKGMDGKSFFDTDFTLMAEKWEFDTADGPVDVPTTLIGETSDYELEDGVWTCRKATGIITVVKWAEVTLPEDEA